MNFAWVIDQRKCIGCHACTTACKSENEVPLSVDRTWVKYVEKGTFPDAQRHFGVLRCNHCAKPPCVDICPVSAMFQRKDGIVEFASDACIGCKACIAACPYDAIYIDPSSGTAAKCNFCTHRLDLGLEPACVVVCPEEALIFGDLDNPDSKVSQLLGREKTQVRKPEKNTDPKCFYIGADEAVLNPDVQAHDQSGLYMWSLQKEDSHGPRLDNNCQAHAFQTDIEEKRPGMSLASALNAVTGARVAYDVPHKAPWGSDVSAYLFTKSISAGVMIIGWLLWILTGVEGKSAVDALVYPGILAWLCPLLSLVFLGLTGIFLIKDLDRPERFWTILTRPQWKSWLAIGAYIILVFSILLAITFMASLARLFDTTGNVSYLVSFLASTFDTFFALCLPFAILTAVYTAFLFAQAKGRDLWQSPLLPLNLLLQATSAGAAIMILCGAFFKNTEPLIAACSWILAGSLVLHLALVLSGELSIEHVSKAQARAVHQMTRGFYSRQFWLGYVFTGAIAPVAMLMMHTIHPCAPLPFAASLAALTGLFIYEHCFVMAGQSVRLS